MFGTHLSRMGSVHRLGLVQRTIGILRKYGTNAHVYLPGVGTISGITAGNYLDSAGTTAASVDNPVGLVVDPLGAVNATQSTTANKPILRRGLLNLIRYSDDQSNAAWTNVNLNVTPGQASSPYGTSDSALLAPTAVSGSHVLYQNNVTIARNVTMAFIAKAGVLQFLSPSNAGAGVLTSTFDLVAGTSANGASTTSSMVSLGGGWWLGAMSFTAAYTAASFYINNSGSASIASFAGNGVDGLYMYLAGLFDGTYTAQQILDAGGIPLTTTSAASNPSAGKYSWQFDGVNDSLSLSAPLFQMSDDHCVIAGFKADAANKYIFSQSHSGTATQCCSLRVDASGYPGAVWIDDAPANALPTATTSCIGLNTVATAIKIGNAKRLRVNGVQAGATNNTALGVGTTNSYSIGCLNVSSGNFQGSIYPVIAIKGTVSDADLLTLERFVGQLSGVSI